MSVPISHVTAYLREGATDRLETFTIRKVLIRRWFLATKIYPPISERPQKTQKSEK